MSAPMKRVVAWLNREEFESVYAELYSEDPVLQRHAAGRVAVWKCRVTNKLSTAIECTWQLVSAQLTDRQLQEQRCVRDRDQQVRMGYGMAIVRFVNLLTEKGQNRVYAQPVHHLAEELGLPEWLVDMRHEATHSALPSLHVLRAAAHFALSWLKTEYWDAQLEDSDSESESEAPRPSSSRRAQIDPNKVAEELDKTFTEYVKEQFKFMRNKNQGHSTKSELSQIKRILEQVESLVKYHREEAIQIVVTDGFLVPTLQQLTALNIDADDLLKTSDLSLPDDLVRFWRPLLRLFHQLELTPLLVHSLLSELGETSSLRDRMIAGWVSTTVAANREAGQDTASHSKSSSIYNRSCDLHSRLLLETTLKHPNVYTAKLIISMLSLLESKVNRDHRESIQRLVHCYTTIPLSGADADVTDHPHIYSVRHLETIRNNKAGDSQQPVCDGSALSGDGQPLQQSSGWRLSTDVVGWSSHPMGSCPGRQVSYTSLELPESVNCLGSEVIARPRPAPAPVVLKTKKDAGELHIYDEDLPTEPTPLDTTHTMDDMDVDLCADIGAFKWDTKDIEMVTLL